MRRTPEGDVPVPITHAYNHHYVAWLKSEHAELRYVDAKHGGHGMAHGARKYWKAVPKAGAPVVLGGDGDTIPLAQVFSEGNGGEFRRSYHGYPEGYGQLVYSPTTFHSNPMQIDTMNRDHPGPGFVAGPLPSTAHAPANATYSGLLECPCTDRLPKVLHRDFAARPAGKTCAALVDKNNDCTTPGQPLSVLQNSCKPQEFSREKLH